VGQVRGLTDQPGRAAVPSITVDFGKVVVGYPKVGFAGASANHPGVRLAFSETTQYLTDISDFTRSDNGDRITPGTDQFAVPCLAGHGRFWTSLPLRLVSGYVQR
jgi:hypothetical protein